MNILIIGGAGFLGSNLTRRCLQQSNVDITVVDSLDPQLKSTKDSLLGVLDRIEFIEGDMRNPALMNEVVQGKDIIFNCAGQTSHPLSIEDPFLDVDINCKGNLTFLEAVKNYNKSAKVVFTSSSTIIGKAVDDVVDETHGEAPLDIYSANKGVAEKYYRIYNQVHGLKTLSLRFANLYGPYGKGYPEFGFINYFISLTQKGEKIKIFGNGQQNRNVLYVEDAAELLYQCASRDDLFGEVYFAVHKEHYSVREIAETIVKVFGQGGVEYIAWPDVRKKIEIDSVIISAAKLYYRLQTEPKYNLKQGLEKTKQIIEQQVLGSKS